MSRNYFNGANAALLVFDVTTNSSLEELRYYHNMLSEVTDVNKVVVGILANKADLKDESTISDAEIDQFATDIGAEFTLTCSAKTGEGMPDIFQLIATSPRLAGQDQGAVSLDTKAADAAALRDKRKRCC
jgi:GTPase SAR1 family protein